MTKLNSNLRHHSARPPSAVKPNTLQPPETASLPTPNPNPSLLGPVGVDAANVRLNSLDMIDDDCDPDVDDDCEDDGDEDEDRSPKHLS